MIRNSSQLLNDRFGSATDGQIQVIRKILSTGCLRPGADNQYIITFAVKVIHKFLKMLLLFARQPAAS